MIRIQNPFLVFFITFSSALLAYHLHWSALYPPLSNELYIFFFCILIASLILMVIVNPLIRKIHQYVPMQLPRYSVIIVSLIFLSDLIYTGYIPIVKILTTPYCLMDFSGVPSLHVLSTTLGSVFSIIRFLDFLKNKRGYLFIEALIPIVFFISIIYRGPILIVLVSWFFLFLFEKKITISRSLAVFMAILLTFFLFGKMGDFREGRGGIEDLGKPTKKFQESGVPAAYFWWYIYHTSPLANFQKSTSQAVQKCRFLDFIVYECLPDVLSKRVSSYLNLDQRVKPPQIRKGLSVATIFTRSYQYMGWFGPPLIFAWLCVFIILYILLIRGTPYEVVGLAILCTVVVFSIFINTISYSPIFLQLIWPLLLPTAKGWMPIMIWAKWRTKSRKRGKHDKI